MRNIYCLFSNAMKGTFMYISRAICQLFPTSLILATVISVFLTFLTERRRFTESSSFNLFQPLLIDV